MLDFNFCVKTKADARNARSYLINENANATKYLQRKLGIYNGQDAAAGAFPYVVLLESTRTNGDYVRCAGVLFAYNLIVTVSKYYILFYGSDSQTVCRHGNFLCMVQISSELRTSFQLHGPTVQK